MSTIIRITILLSVAILLNSCIASLHPIYDENNLAHDPGLDGRWVSVKKQGSISKSATADAKKDTAVLFEFETIQVEKEDKQGQKTLYLMKNFDTDTAEFYVHMVEINAEKYLDFFVKQYNFSNDMAELCFFPVHTFCKFNRSGDTLKLFAFDVKHIQKLIKLRKIKLEAESSNGRLLLTASTEALQKFLHKYGNDPEFYETEPEVYIRQKDD